MRANKTNTQSRSRGFTLIAALLLLTLMSAISIGLFMMVSTETKVGGSDVQNNLAFHNAEGAIEMMSSQLITTFQTVQAPQASNICAISNSPPPSTGGVTYPVYSVRPSSGVCTGTAPSDYGLLTGGANQGLYAQLIPISMQVTAQQPLGQQVTMMRTAQVALIPVFQFGAFSESDLAFFSNPTITFNGRVHTNGDLYLGVANSNTLTFGDKLTAYGNIATGVIPNGLSISTANDTGTVLVPTAPQGCASGPSSTCRRLQSTEGSWTSTSSLPPAPPAPPAVGTMTGQNSNWPTISLGSSYYNGMIKDGNYGGPNGTGVKKLNLPFVPGGVSSQAPSQGPFQYEIVRRPPAGESSLSPLGSARLANLAQIRVLFSDDPTEMWSNPGNTDGQTIRLANLGAYARGVPTSVKAGMTALAGGATYNTWFAEASNNNADDKNPTGAANCLSAAALGALLADWTNAPGTANLGTQPDPNLGGGKWRLVDGYLRVEYKDNAGNWNGVTTEWLQYGFARNVNPPTAAAPNDINPNAILLLQQPADRSGNGVLDPAYAGSCSGGTPNPRPAELNVDAASNNNGTNGWFYGSSANATSPTRYNWYPINFYDAREGEPRDVKFANLSCTANGVMNAVEIDVNNLKKWLNGTLAGSGAQVNSTAQNGYILYFSDRRGMLQNPNGTLAGTANTKTGDSGLEDSVNRASSAGTPDGALEAIPAGRTLSPEDVNQNGFLDNWGARNLGEGFYNVATNINGLVTANAPVYDPYASTAAANRIQNCGVTGRKNWVSGARHVLKLVNGGMTGTATQLPMAPTNPPSGGFTVASENPVYVEGDYNTTANDTIWSTGADDPRPHAAAAIIADAVTLLSNNWNDRNSMTVQPTEPVTNRDANNTYYRMAVAGGKNINLVFPTWAATNPDYPYSTDGGVGNFLRFLEDWSGATLNYEGSLVSLYYSAYATGTFKCCTYSVYRPPNRNYVFDPDFAVPQGLPPGTPMFRDVDSLSYRQYFNPRTY